MKKRIGNFILGLTLYPFTFLFNSCSPIGKPVNPEISKNHYYNKSKTGVIWSRQGNWFALGKTPMNVDVASFEVLNPYLSKDHNQIYYFANPIDPNTVSIEKFYAKEGYLNYYIGFDDKHVYTFTNTETSAGTEYTATIIDSAKPDSFSYYEIDWAKDKEHYFYRNTLVNVDFDSFTHLNEHYSMDKNSAFAHINGNFHTLPLTKLETFDVFKDSYYAYDNEHIYYLNQPGDTTATSPITTIKANTTKRTRLLNKEYLKSGEHIYFAGKPLKNVDSENFEIVGVWYGKDKENVYYKDQLITGADAATFTLQEVGYGVEDKHGTYIGGQLAPKPIN